MSLPPYPEYKDSGVDWIGCVPMHWNACRLKDIAEVINGFPFDSRLFSIDGEYALVRIRDIDAKEAAIRYSGDFVPSVAVTSSDVLIGMDGDFNVGRWLGSEAALLNQRVCCVRTSSAALSVFLRHALPAPLRAINDVTYATTVKHLSSLDVEKIIFFLPEASELVKISSFLDSETGRIDALIAEQERLLLLLADRRQAFASRVVFSGLGPGSDLKDSGVSWLGQVPVYWKVLTIKRLVVSIEQGWSPQCENYQVESDGEWGVMKVGCVNGGVFSKDENKKLPDELEPVLGYSLKRNDLLISRANTRELVGSAAVVPEDHPCLLLCDKLYRLRLNEGLCDPRFMAAFLGSAAARAQIEISATGASSSMLNIGQGVILEMAIALPPLPEQEEIMKAIDSELDRLDRLKAEVETALALLKERRAALISAAVTGKIDVRDLA